MADHRERLVPLVWDFIQAENWAESRRIVEANQDALLSDDADAILADLIEANAANDDGKRILERHRALLARCRSDGIEAAFADLMSPADADPLVRLIQQFIEAESWAVSKR